MDPKTMWGAGDYTAIAERITEVGDACVQRAGVDAEMDVLDIGCGTGNATIPAVHKGARVTGLDFQPELLEIARRRAAEERVKIDWVEGDAQDLPFEDAGFDRTLSALGHMFAPDHERTAAEMKRVTRAHGRISICCWTPEGSIGRMFRARLLGDGDFERREVEWRDQSVESYGDSMLESFGPLLNAQEILGDRSGELRDALMGYFEGENLESDGTLRYRGEYLAAVVPMS